MTDDTEAKASGEVKLRKRRKWDQPAETVVSGLPLTTGGIIGISPPGAVPITSSVLTNPVTATHATPQNVNTIVNKLNQPKIQDELIAREIVINDAEPSVRYKLTKRQTQEEIQKCTGAVVITRGKYKAPGGLPDGEKPLFLHISASSHLKDTAEHIKAVDKAALIVEEILKQGHSSQLASSPLTPVLSNSQIIQPLSICLYLGFDVDSSLNIASRIRGPNDQYINHIVNETGASVVLRGKDSGNSDNTNSEGSQQPLHLYISSPNAKSLEAAKILAENLLDTIAAEFRTSRVSTSKSYTAVPPPPQLLLSTVQSSPVTPAPRPPPVRPYYGNSHTPPVPILTGGTHYDGYYEGIYPQATPLQQVALALKQANPATVNANPSSVVGSNSNSISISNSSMSLSLSVSAPSSTSKKPPQKRKFQELPVSAVKGSAIEHQNSQKGSEFVKLGSEDSDKRENSSQMPPPKKPVEPSTNGMPPPQRPLSKNVMPPPPPKFISNQNASNNSIPPPLPKFWSRQSPPVKPATGKSSAQPASDTLVKLVEYGEEDEDTEETLDLFKTNSNKNSGPKPFWAV